MAETYIPVAIQRLVLAESKGCCEYCWSRSNFSSSSFHFDHIIPVSKEGLSTFDNIARSCGGCNGFKQDKTAYFDPLTHELCPLYNPRRDKWSEHFQWSADDLTVEGITSVGRTTVELLQVNRISNTNLRELLKTVNLHPPF